MFCASVDHAILSGFNEVGGVHFESRDADVAGALRWRLIDLHTLTILLTAFLSKSATFDPFY